MWVSKKIQALLDQQAQQILDTESWRRLAEGERTQLKIENARLRADMDWFKLRLNQVERERGQLIQSAIGVKISVPEFVPTHEDPSDALNQMPDTSTVGGDAVDEGEPTIADPGNGVDYSLMPGYKGK